MSLVTLELTSKISRLVKPNSKLNTYIDIHVCDRT